MGCSQWSINRGGDQAATVTHCDGDWCSYGRQERRLLWRMDPPQGHHTPLFLSEDGSLAAAAPPTAQYPAEEDENDAAVRMPVYLLIRLSISACEPTSA